MNWKFNPKTGTMEMQKRTGINVSARQGGIMVEDYDRHLQFLINYGSSRITHCVGCRADDLHLFDDRKANEIANKVKRIGIGKGIATEVDKLIQSSQKCSNVTRINI